MGICSSSGGLGKVKYGSNKAPPKYTPSLIPLSLKSFATLCNLE